MRSKPWIQLRRRVLALNSYENRVYQIGVETASRWSPSSTVPAAGAMRRFARSMVFRPNSRRRKFPCRAHHAQRRVAVRSLGLRSPFPSGAAAGPNRTAADREWVAGSWGASTESAGRPIPHRGRLDAHQLGRAARDFVLDGDWMPDYSPTSTRLTESLLGEIEARTSGGAARGSAASSRLSPRQHLVTDLGPHFVDLDDCLTGPAVQDCGCCCRESEKCARTHDILRGYEQFLPFDGVNWPSSSPAGAAHDPLLGLAGAAWPTGIPARLPVLRAALLEEHYAR